MFNIEALQAKPETELKKILKDLGVKVGKNAANNDKVFAILDFQASNKKLVKEYLSAAQSTGTAAAEEQAEEKPAPKKRGRKPAAKKTEETPEAPAETPAELPEENVTVEEKPQQRRQQKNNSRKKAEPGNQPAEPEAPSETPAEPLKETSKEQPQRQQQNQNQQRHNNGNQSRNQNGRSQNGAQQNQNRQSPQQSQPEKEPTEQKKDFNFDGIVEIEGVLEILPDNYGFLRSSDFSYISSPDDVYVSTNQIRNYGLKTGDTVKGIVRLPKEGEKYFSLLKPVEVNGRDLAFIKDRVAFEYLTPLFPQEKFNLAGKGSTISTRAVDMFAPIGKGQRAMIVAQPKTGKTMLLKDIANAIAANHPEAYMMVLLIDERPEEVTDMERSVNAEVIASTFDEAADKHVKVANLVLAKAQRMVECGHDVVILLDSITRLARAYNTVTPASGKILSGGVDANALHKPKRFFGAARKIEGGGSLTIIATALIDTGSKMDEVIFEEFKGTGNMELQLDRKIANKRVYPAIDLVASSTRRDDLLLDEKTHNLMWILRKYLSDMNPAEAMEFVEKNLKGTLNNEEFLMSMNR